MSEIAKISVRPVGLPPKGSAYGLMAIGMLPGAILFIIMQSLVPVTRGGTDLWLDSILPAFAITVVSGTIVAFGLAGRRGWYIRFVFTFGWFLVAAFGVGLALGLAILCHLVPEAAPDLSFVSFANIIAWLVISPVVWLLTRTLRLRYWQPGTTASQWEPADETPASRTLLMAWVNRKR